MWTIEQGKLTEMYTVSTRFLCFQEGLGSVRLLQLSNNFNFTQSETFRFA